MGRNVAIVSIIAFTLAMACIGCSDSKGGTAARSRTV